MAFCSTCGKQLGETAAFCDGCGTKTGGDSSLAVTEAKDVLTQTVSKKELSQIEDREQVLGQMYVCYDAILAIGVAHDEFKTAETELEKVTNDIAFADESIPVLEKIIANSPSEEELTALQKKVSMVIIIIFLGGFPAISLVSEILWRLHIDGPYLALFMVSYIIIYIYVCKKADNADASLEKLSKAKKRLQILSVNIPPLQKKVEELELVLQGICEEESSLFMKQYLPKDYCNLDAVGSFISYLENKRADTFKEAINVYEDEKHKAKMQEMQEISLDKLHTQSVMMAESMQQQAQWQAENARRQERMIANTQKINEEIRFGNAVAVINLVDRWEQEGRLKK